MLDDDLDYCVKRYTAEQVVPHADACKATGCPSYIHCFFGSPQPGQFAFPVCAVTIQNAMKGDRTNALAPAQ